MSTECLTQTPEKNVSESDLFNRVKVKTIYFNCLIYL